MIWNRPVTEACNFNDRRCMCLKKKRYDTKEKADAKLEKRMASEKNPPEYLRAYHCIVCKGWHLTKQKR